MSGKSKRSKVFQSNHNGLPESLGDALPFPLMDSIMGRRSRRFPVGAEIPEGPLKFASKKSALPLTELEQMIILSSVSGNACRTHEPMALWRIEHSTLSSIPKIPYVHL